MMKKTVLTLTASLALSLATFASATDDHPGNLHWACHVTTQSGAAGLVMLDTKEKKRAQEFALRSRALTMQDTWEQPRSIVECVQMPGGTFRDEAFNEFHGGILM